MVLTDDKNEFCNEEKQKQSADDVKKRYAIWSALLTFQKEIKEQLSSSKKNHLMINDNKWFIQFIIPLFPWETVISISMEMITCRTGSNLQVIKKCAFLQYWNPYRVNLKCKQCFSKKQN